MSAKFAIVTATLDYVRAEDCLTSWIQHTQQPGDLYTVYQGIGNVEWEGVAHHSFLLRTREILGVVPAFALGVQKALDDGAEVIACLHDDLEILEDGWDQTVLNLFKACPRAGLCGFGGGKGLGSDDIYQTPYNPMQLARQTFISNMKDAEAHGMRVEVAQPVACLDGFSQIGRADFWRGLAYDRPWMEHSPEGVVPLFQKMQSWGVTHHFYDGMLGCLAKRLGWQTWFLPVKCHHFGGRTAVGDARYIEWANTQRPTGLIDTAQPSGDQIFWLEAHQIGYDQFRDVLPIRV